MIGQKLDLNKYEVIKPQNIVGQKLNTARFEKIPQKNINIFNNESKEVFNAPQNMDEDELRYNYQKQIEGKDEGNFWGMTDISDPFIGQPLRAITATLISIPSTLGLAYRAAVGAQKEWLEELKKMPDTKGMTEYERVTYGLLTGKPYEATFMKDIDLRAEAEKQIIKEEVTIKKLTKLRDKTIEYLDKTKLSKQAGDGFVYDLSGNIVNFVAAIGGSAFLGNPAFISAYFGALATGSASEEMLAKGYSYRYTNSVAWKHGVRQGVLENLGINLFGNAVRASKPIQRTLAGAISRAIKKVFKSKALRAGAGEGLEEVLQGIDEEITLQKFGSRQKGLWQSIKDISYQGAMGFIIGAPAGFIVSMAQKTAQEGGVNKELAKNIVDEVQKSDIVQKGQKLIDNQISVLTQNEKTIIEGIDKTVDNLSEQLKEHKKGIKNKVTEMSINAGVDEQQAEVVSDLWQARADAAGASLGISSQEWFKAKNLQIIGEGKTINEAIQEETEIEAIERPTEVLFQKEQFDYLKSQARNKELFKDTIDIRNWIQNKISNVARPTKDDISKLNTYLKENKDKEIILFHGTGEQVPITTEGIKKTSAKTAKSLQTARGFVNLTYYPTTAQTFAEMAYPQQKPKVYAVRVKISELLADKDQLKNKRMWAEIDIGDTLADSLLYGFSAKVKRNILPYELTEIEITDILRQEARGQIEFGPDSTVIRLFQGKDRTTLLHETGHLFLRDMQAVAEQTQDPQALEDMQVLRDFYKVKEGEAFSREKEEAFADDFVGFVMSGKAPSAKLVGAFERFKQWLLSLYERVKTRVTLTPEVREVLDRMLGGYDVETATTSEIADLSTRMGELSTLAENIKAGRLADITQTQLDELEALINAAKQRGPAEPQSLFGWIRRRGGIWDKGGELRDMDLPAGLIRTKADSYLPTQALYNALDTTREAAVTEGFLKEDADINDLINAIAQEAKGDKVYRRDDLDQLERRESVLKDKDDAEMILSQLDINPEEILQIIRKNRAKQLKAVPTPEFAGVLSRIERLERAVGRIATEQERLTEAQIKAITKADIREIQNRVIDLIKSARLEAKDRAKFIDAIKKIQTGEQLARILPSLQERIARYRETTQKANIREQIRKELARIKPAVITGKLKGKFDAETQEALQTFRDIEKMTIEQAREKWQKVFEVAKAMQYKPNELELKQHLWLQIQAYYKASTQADLQEVLDYIRELKSVARIKLFERIQAEKEKRQAMIERTKKAVDATKPFDPKAVQQQKGWKKYFNWIFDHLNVWAHDWNSLLNKILADKTLSEMFSVKVEDAEFKKQELWNKDNANMKSMLMEAYNLPESQISEAYAKQMDIIEFENILGSDNVKRNHTFRRGQLIDMFAASKNEETKAILTDPEIHAFSEQGLNALFGELTEQDKKLANLLIKYYDEKGYPELNKSFSKNNGINLPRVKGIYYPRSREGKFAEDENIITQVIYQASTTPQAIKLRAKSKARLTFMNALSRLERYNEEKNIYISMAEVVSELNSIFRDQDLRAKIKGKFTPKTMQAIDAHLKTFGLETQKDIDSLWVQARGAFTGLKTGISTVIFLKQLTSLAAYTEVLSAGQFISGVIDFMRHPVKNAKWLRENSEFLKFRISARAFDRDIKALERSKLARLTAITKWNDFMTAFVRAGDIMAIYPGMWAMIKAGKTMREAERFSNRTQQSASASKMSLAQKGTPYQRLFTMFKSAPLQYHRKLMIATKDMVRGNISKKQGIRIYTIYAVILPALFSAVGQGFRPDKEWKEFFNNILTGNIGAIFMLGDLIKMLSASTFGMKFYPPSFPFWDEFEDLAKELPKAVKSDLDDVKWDDLLTSILEVSTPFTGVMIPAKRGWNVAEGIYEVFDGENRTKGLLKMAGYTDYRAKKIIE